MVGAGGVVQKDQHPMLKYRGTLVRARSEHGYNWSPEYQGQVFLNRRPWPDGPEYDCCGGLGYYAAHALANGAAHVQSFEKNPDVVWLRRLNPWSPDVDDPANALFRERVTNRSRHLRRLEETRSYDEDTLEIVQ